MQSIEKSIGCFKNVKLTAFLKYHIKNDISRIRSKYIRKTEMIMQYYANNIQKKSSVLRCQMGDRFLENILV